MNKEDTTDMKHDLQSRWWFAVEFALTVRGDGHLGHFEGHLERILRRPARAIGARGSLFAERRVHVADGHQCGELCGLSGLARRDVSDIGILACLQWVGDQRFPSILPGGLKVRRLGFPVALQKQGLIKSKSKPTKEHLIYEQGFSE